MFNFKKKLNDDTIEEMISFTFKLLKRTRPELPDDKIMVLTEGAILRADSEYKSRDSDIFCFSGGKGTPTRIPVPVPKTSGPFLIKRKLPEPENAIRNSLPPQRKRNLQQPDIQKPVNENSRRTTLSASNLEKTEGAKPINVFERLYSMRKKKQSIPRRTPTKTNITIKPFANDVQSGAPENKKLRFCCPNREEKPATPNQSVFERLYSTRKSCHLHKSEQISPKILSKERNKSQVEEKKIGVSCDSPSWSTSDLGSQEDFSEDEVMNSTPKSTMMKDCKDNNVKDNARDINMEMENIYRSLDRLALKIKKKQFEL